MENQYPYIDRIYSNHITLICSKYYILPEHSRDYANSLTTKNVTNNLYIH